MSEKSPYVEVKNLKKHFQLSRKETLKAVDGVSFTIHKGQTVGLVGESGCGKSTTGRCLVKLYAPTDGSIYLEGADIHQLKKKEHLGFCRRVQMIFQNPYASLNARMTISEIVGEGIQVHQNLSRSQSREQVEDLLEMVGLSRTHANRFPHEFSGGQRQRIGIARALSVNPDFVVCDEPISALDVSIQAQVVNLLLKFQRDRGLTYLFIAHDLSMVKYVSDYIAVMYLGAIVEYTTAGELYQQPLHPYTKALLSSIPVANPKLQESQKRIMLEGDVPSPVNPPNCCKFAERCAYVMPICREIPPPLKELSADHHVACHLY